MKHKHLIAMLIVTSLVFIGITLMVPSTTVSYQKEEPVEAVIKEIEPLKKEEILTVEPLLSHAQTVWLHALEWCESNGVPEAVNPMDSDGTPSYGSWQFKPSTFWHFASKYDVSFPKEAESHLKRENQLKVITQMIMHKEEINWSQQFPACTRKIGNPPN